MTIFEKTGAGVAGFFLEQEITVTARMQRSKKFFTEMISTKVKQLNYTGVFFLIRILFHSHRRCEYDLRSGVFFHPAPARQVPSSSGVLLKTGNHQL